MTDLLASYRAHGPGHDEMLQSIGPARAAWDQMADLVELHSWDQLEAATTEVSSMLADQWVRHGTDARDRPWALDPLPVMLDESEWAGIEAALRQRAELHDAILTDLYGERRLLTSGAIPPELVLSHPGFLRSVDQITIPGQHQLFLHAADLARNADGTWRVLGDRTQSPSGMGFAMADRRVIGQVLSGLYRQARIRRLGPFFHALRTALHDVAPPSAGDSPRIAMLTPGPYSETAFDQGYLSAMLGLPLVEGEDLDVSEGRLWMRSVDGREPVDVLIRRVDAEYCDPLDLRGDSRLGVAGLVQAAREGTVTVVNTLGSGVLENPALLTHLPQLCRTLRGEELLMPSAVTYWCGQRSMCSHVIANIDRLVLRHTSPSAPAIHGWDLGPDARADLSAQIAAHPHQWVGQEPVEASTTPTVGPGALQARPTMLRTFAVAQQGGYQVMSGALARVTSRPVEIFDPPATAALAKDLWVLSREPQPALEPWLREDDLGPRLAPAHSISAGAAEDLFWFGRYSERAEATVRFMRVLADLWADYHALPNSPGGRSLAVVQHVLGDVTTTGDLQELLLDNRPGTVSYAVDRMTRAATAVRDQLSSDTWLALSGIDRALNRERARRRAGTSGDPGRALSRITEGLLALAGIGAESMVRDVGWALMDIGRRIERAQHLVMTVRAALHEQRDAAVDSGVLEALLSAHESVITYRRRYQTHARVDTVLDLLMLDKHNPRSLRYQLDLIALRISAVPTPVRETSSRDQLLDDLHDLLDEADTTVLAQADSAEHRALLSELMESLQWRLSELGREIARLHFAHRVPSQWQDTGGLQPWHDEAAGSLGTTTADGDGQ